MGLIRFLLAVSVFVGHCGTFWGNYFIDGRVAVECFFMISGFYMSLVLNGKYAGLKNGYFRFLSNRFLRLWPTYWIALWLMILGDPLDINRAVTATLDSSTRFLAWFANAFLVGIDWLFFFWI